MRAARPESGSDEKVQQEYGLDVQSEPFGLQLELYNKTYAQS